MELYIVRHGKTIWNKERRLQGSIDIELAEEGIEAAELLHDQLISSNITFDRIYSSPLKRAKKTAEIIRGLNDTDIIIDQRLREISFGVEEGAFYADWDRPDSPYFLSSTARETMFRLKKGNHLNSFLKGQKISSSRK